MSEALDRARAILKANSRVVISVQANASVEERAAFFTSKRLASAAQALARAKVAADKAAQEVARQEAKHLNAERALNAAFEAMEAKGDENAPTA